VESRNKLDTMILSIEKTIKENREKIEAADLQTVEAALEKARSVIKDTTQDKVALDAAYDELMRASHGMAEKLYKQNSQTPGAQSSSAPNGATADRQEEPIDAEINS
jgi:molecular chaperone DnaK